MADLILEDKVIEELITNSFFREPESEKQWVTWRADERLRITRACGCVGLCRAAHCRKPLDQSAKDESAVDVLNQTAYKH